MDRLKTFLIYLIILVAFFFFSNFLIFVGLNTNYKKISSVGDIPPQIQINQAEATLVNGRIRGIVTNNEGENIDGKYIKTDLYSPRGVLLGTKYLELQNLSNGAQEEFELYFKAKEVENFKMTITDNMEAIDKSLDVFIGKDLSRTEVLIGVIAILICLA